MERSDLARDVEAVEAGLKEIGTALLGNLGGAPGLFGRVRELEQDVEGIKRQLATSVTGTFKAVPAAGDEDVVQKASVIVMSWLWHHRQPIISLVTLLLASAATVFHIKECSNQQHAAQHVAAPAQVESKGP